MQAVVLPVYDPSRFPLPGTDVPSQVLNKVGEEAKKYVCWYQGFTPPLPDPFGVLASGRAFIRNLTCPPNPTQPPPGSVQLPFSGGQCAVDYVVKMTTTFTNCSTGNFAFNQSPTITVRGPIGSFGIVDDGPGGFAKLRANKPDGTAAQATGLFAQWVPCNRGGTEAMTSYTITSIVRADGQPDNCGDPPGTVIPEPNRPPLPPIGFRVWPFNLPITYPNGNTFTFPLVFNNIRPTLNVGPFNFDLDLGGIPIHVDLGGVHFGGGGSGGDGAPPPVPQSIPCIEELCEMATDYLTERQIGLLASSCDSEGEPVAFPAQGSGFGLLKQVFEQLNEAAQYRQFALCEAAKGAAPPSLEWVSLGDKILSGVLNFPANELFYGVRTIAKIVPIDLRTRYSAIRKRQIGSIAYGQGGFLREEHYVHWDGWLLQPLPLSGDILSYSFQPGCTVEIQVLREVQEQA